MKTINNSIRIIKILHFSKSRRLEKSQIKVVICFFNIFERSKNVRKLEFNFKILF